MILWPTQATRFAPPLPSYTLALAFAILGVSMPMLGGPAQFHFATPANAVNLLAHLVAPFNFPEPSR